MSDDYSLDYLRNSLSDKLEEISKYTEELNRLNAQTLTIKVNLANYSKRLKTITEKAKNNQLEVLTKFGEYAAEKYQQDVEIDYAYFSSGVSLLENTIKTIEGIINIEQTKSERTLNELVATASVGLAISAVTATVIVAQPLGDTNPLEFYLTKIVISLLWGIVGAISKRSASRCAGYLLWKTYVWLEKICRKKLE